MELTINGEKYEVDVPEGEMLVWVLRDTIGLTGTKATCGIGICGVCAVHMDGMATRACITPASTAEGRDLTTIEGLVTIDGDGNEILHPVQQGFIDAQVPQCSWCMSGQMMTAATLLERNPDPDDDAIINAMSSNYCRCGCYTRIKAGIQRAAEIKKEREA